MPRHVAFIDRCCRATPAGKVLKTELRKHIAGERRSILAPRTVAVRCGSTSDRLTACFGEGPRRRAAPRVAAFGRRAAAARRAAGRPASPSSRFDNAGLRLVGRAAARTVPTRIDFGDALIETFDALGHRAAPRFTARTPAPPSRSAPRCRLSLRALPALALDGYAVVRSPAEQAESLANYLAPIEPAVGRHASRVPLEPGEGPVHGVSRGT